MLKALICHYCLKISKHHELYHLYIYQISLYYIDKLHIDHTERLLDLL